MRPMILASAAVAVLVASAPILAEAGSTPRVVESAVAPFGADAVRADRLEIQTPKAGRARPLVVVVADNAGAETTDFLIPYGVLKESGVAEVRSLSTEPGPVRLFRALTIRADQTLAQFDATEPTGADIVIVPAQIRADSPKLIAWIRYQAARGATIVSICEGARVLAHAGLLDGRRATTHWHALPDLSRRYPSTNWVRDRRYVQDGAIISTTGVSASIPVSLALVDSIGGRRVATDLARRLGANGWSAAHRTDDYALSAADYARALLDMGAIWRHETLQAPITDGFDEIGLGLRADAWSRTFRANVVTTHAGRRAVRSRHGLVFIPDAEATSGGRRLDPSAAPAVQQLQSALTDIRRTYGVHSARLTALGLELAREERTGI